MIECACGCGQLTKTKWVKGHNRRRHWRDYPTETTATGCVRWLGPCKDSGYGFWRGRVIHRVVWENTNGPVPEGLVLDHVYDRGCRHRDCINLSHLEPVPQPENARRMPHIRAQVAQTHCKHGHPLSGDNLNLRKDGKRGCRTCSREAAARSNNRKKTGKWKR